MRLTLNRTERIGKSVLGSIQLPGRKIVTLDDADEMLPNGFYHMVPFTGIKYKNTWCLVGQHSSVYPEPGVKKSTCLMHAGDTHEDTTGCVLIGLQYHYVNGEPDIDFGARALSYLRSVLVSDQNHYLTIQGVS